MSKHAVVAEAGTHVLPAAQWVVFRCSGERFGFPLERVSEIITPRGFTRLPGAGAEVCGLVGLRGRVITVFDLGIVLGLGSPAAAQPDHRLLLLELGARRLGAAVETVDSIGTARVRAAREDGGPAGRVGTGRSEDGEFTAIEPETLLQRLLQS